MSETVFTIGHSNHPIEDFLDLLRLHEVDLVADVRSQPFSQHSPHFSKPAIGSMLESQAIRYVALGKELGGRPDDPAFYDEAGHVKYWKVAESEGFVQGLERLESLLHGARVVIMCSEEDPTGCHRRLLVGRTLAERGVRSLHIRGNGLVQREDELPDVLGLCQPALFGGATEETGWKSLRSVSPRRRPRSSSDY